jgi:hypothetical protein
MGVVRRNAVAAGVLVCSTGCNALLGLSEPMAFPDDADGAAALDSSAVTADDTLDGGSAGDSASTRRDADGSSPLITDGSSTPEADVVQQVETGPPTFCDTLNPRPSFCSDFDKTLPLYGFTSNYVETGCTAQLDTTTPKSAPASLHTSCGSLADQVFLHALYDEILTGPATTARLNFDVKLNTAITGGVNRHATIFRIRYGDGTGGARFFIEYGSYGGTEKVVETLIPAGGNPAYTDHLTAMPAVGAWVHVDVQVVLSPTPRVRLWLDGVQKIDDPVSPPYSTGAPTLQLGLDIGGQIDPTDALFDNVTFNAL